MKRIVMLFLFVCMFTQASRPPRSVLATALASSVCTRQPCIHEKIEMHKIESFLAPLALMRLQHSQLQEKVEHMQERVNETYVQVGLMDFEVEERLDKQGQLIIAQNERIEVLKQSLAAYRQQFDAQNQALAAIQQTMNENQLTCPVRAQSDAPYHSLEIEEADDDAQRVHKKTGLQKLFCCCPCRR